MNLANKLTLSRVAVIPIFLVCVLPESFGLPEPLFPYLRSGALLIFIGATITDYYDGVLARRHGWITNFGKLFDPLADKMIVMTAFVALIEVDLAPGKPIFPSWMVILILCREFLITGLRTLAVSQGRVVSADRWGKNKTITQMTVIITALVFLAARDILSATGHWKPYFIEESYFARGQGIAHWLTLLLRVMMLLCVALTVVSGWVYLRKNWNLIREDV
jgi:CDP-diacylglycerol--glycerol-3-phosphate 3-phosphatidyltransferase